ncbi:hypothetical protein [Embleya sp. NPDC059237]|uniref:protein kinase domain-containing protein n=1 Tax=Embleya sp. NPDC059237 TaxID=3346784 RepID=UPI00367EBE25
MTVPSAEHTDPTDTSRTKSVAATATNTRKGWGTVAYMAPEIWTSEREAIAADVYASGVIGYELPTGRWPFRGPYGHDFRQRHLRESPPRLTSTNSGVTLRRWLVA